MGANEDLRDLEQRLARAQKAAELRRQLAELGEEPRKNVRSRKIFYWIASLLAAGGMAASLLLLFLSPQADNNQELSKQITNENPTQNKKEKTAESKGLTGDETKLPIAPTIDLECPDDTDSSASSKEVSFGANWNWNSKAGFGSITIDYGDRTNFTANSTKEARSEAFKHEYRRAGTYEAVATISDGYNQQAVSSCEWTWTKANRPKTPSPSLSASSSPISSILTRSYTWMESSSRVTALQRKINEILGTSKQLDGAYGPTTYSNHRKALIKEGASSYQLSRLPKAPETSSSNSSNSGSGGTASNSPMYELREVEGKNLRWSPCRGRIQIWFNPNNQLSEDEINKWYWFFHDQAVEIMQVSGLDVVSMGQTSANLDPFWRDGGDIDIIFFFGPRGSSDMIGWNSPTDQLSAASWSSGDITDPGWIEIESHEVHINTEAKHDFPSINHHILRLLGSAFGLGYLPSSYGKEIMASGWGAGGQGYAKFGPGDKLGLQKVGASNPCFNPRQ
jgi:hypothetical protein